jgi:predicted GNAT family acetyltransferase/glutaredoxin
VADQPLVGCEGSMLTLHQAEWCPFSSAVREVLTELGLDFVARQVEPWPEEREALRARTGSDQIPALETEDGRVFTGTRAIFAFLETLPVAPDAAEHRQRFDDHLPARESDTVGQLVSHFRHDEAGAEPDGAPEDARVVHVPEQSRYEISLGDRRIGLAAYRRREGQIAFTHTEIDPACEGRGFGTRLVAAALEDAAREGLTVRPLCPFVAAYVQRHPELQPLLA